MSFAYRVSKFNRNRKWKLFLERFDPQPDTTVLDVGFSDVELSETDNFIEKFYPFPAMLTALGLGPAPNFGTRYPQVKCVMYDGAEFPFDDKCFDVCWSNAVVEHVGDRNAQRNFLKEIARVSRQAFITTPNRYFPIEVHTRTPLLHLLPKPVFEGYLNLIGKGWATGDYMNLLSLGEIKALLKEANIAEFEIIKNKILGFSLDFVIILGPSEFVRDHAY